MTKTSKCVKLGNDSSSYINLSSPLAKEFESHFVRRFNSFLQKIFLDLAVPHKFT